MSDRGGAVAEAGAPPAPRPRRIPAVCHDAAEEARRRLEEADAGARAALAAARGEAAALREAAARAGREEGRAAATELLARAALVRDRWLAAAEQELAELALAVAARVLAGWAARDPGAVRVAARRALAAARAAAAVTVRAHPADLAALAAEAPALRARLAGPGPLRLVPDAGVERGGVRVETEAGVVDATFAAQLAALRAALQEAG